MPGQEREVAGEPTAILQDMRGHLLTNNPLLGLVDVYSATVPTLKFSPRKLRLERVGDVVLVKLACAPAGDVKVLVVNGEVDVRHKRWTGFEAFEYGRKLIGLGGFRRD
jgi:hypothetical protein